MRTPRIIDRKYIQVQVQGPEKSQSAKLKK